MNMSPDSLHSPIFAARDLLLGLVKGMKQLTSDIAEVKTHFAVLKTKATESRISLSAADLGASEIQKLKRLGCLLKFQAQSGDSILTMEEKAFVDFGEKSCGLYKRTTASDFEASSCLLNRRASVALDNNKDLLDEAEAGFIFLLSRRRSQKQLVQEFLHMECCLKGYTLLTTKWKEHIRLLESL